MRQFLMLSLAFCVVSALPAQAQIPRMVSYQGVVADSAGAPIPDGAYAITFRLYPAANGGTALWQEPKTIQLRRGLISTTLGDQVFFGASVDFSQPYWLGIQIGTDPEMQPRVRLTSSGYSIRAEKSDTSLFALTAPTPAVVDSARIAGSISNNAVTAAELADGAVTSAKILNGTIQRLDVASNFKAPRADTADYALVGTASGWALAGNPGTTAGVNFVGTTDAQPFDIRTNNVLRTRITTKGQIESYNTGQSVFIGEEAGANDDLSSNQNVFVGFRAGFSNTTGSSNSAIGAGALYANTTGGSNTANGVSALNFNTTGGENTANGALALYANTVGSNNTANGYSALLSNTAGGSNTASGYRTLYFNSTGNSNTANGADALYFNSTGSNNTAGGHGALLSNTTGNGNSANGVSALRANTEGSFNTACGVQALFANTTGAHNTANGMNALRANSTGVSNTASGWQAMYFNTTGAYNTAHGENALYSTTASQYNVAVGYRAGDSYDNGYNNVFLGANTDVNGAGYYNVVAIGQATTVTASNQARIGNLATNSIGGYANWTNFSDGRFKRNVKEDVKGLDFIMKLRPVTYNLDVSGLSQKLDESRGDKMSDQMNASMAENERPTRSGFVAQEVERAAKELGYDFSGVDAPQNEGDFYGLRYAEFVVPLVKAVQEQQKKIDALQKEIEELRGERKK